MGRQWNTIIESLGGLTGGTISINANLTDIDALLTTLQADVADGISITTGTIDTLKNLDFIKLSSTSGYVTGTNYNFMLGYAKRTADKRWDIGDLYVWQNENDQQWELVSVNEDDSGIVAYSGYSANRNRSNLPPQTGWTFSSGWSGAGFAISYEQPNEYAKLQDGAGNLITSTTIGSKQRLDVNLSSAGTVGSAIPTTANLYAGTDGTNLRAVSVDTAGRVNVNQVRGTTTFTAFTATTSHGTIFASNSTRNYLLIQCTSGTAYIDTNGTATTTGGIQLISGQAITFEGSFIPTGAITAITSSGTAALNGRQG
jgi:hypothetical protein